MSMSGGAGGVAMMKGGKDMAANGKAHLPGRPVRR